MSSFAEGLPKIGKCNDEVGVVLGKEISRLP